MFELLANIQIFQWLGLDSAKHLGMVLILYASVLALAFILVGWEFNFYYLLDF